MKIARETSCIHGRGDTSPAMQPGVCKLMIVAKWYLPHSGSNPDSSMKLKRVQLRNIGRPWRWGSYELSRAFFWVYCPLTRRCATFGGRRVSSTSTCQPRGGIATVIRMFIAATTTIPQLRFARAKRRKINSHRNGVDDHFRRTWGRKLRVYGVYARKALLEMPGTACVACRRQERSLQDGSSMTRVIQCYPVDRCVDCDSKKENCEKRSILFFFDLGARYVFLARKCSANWRKWKPNYWKEDKFPDISIR